MGDMSVEMATAHRCIPAVSRPVVEGGIAVDLAACAPVKGGEVGSAVSKHLSKQGCRACRIQCPA